MGSSVDDQSSCRTTTLTNHTRNPMSRPPGQLWTVQQRAVRPAGVGRVGQQRIRSGPDSPSGSRTRFPPAPDIGRRSRRSTRLRGRHALAAAVLPPHGEVRRARPRGRRTGQPLTPTGPDPRPTRSRPAVVGDELVDPEQVDAAPCHRGQRRGGQPVIRRRDTVQAEPAPQPPVMTTIRRPTSRTWSRVRLSGSCVQPGRSSWSVSVDCSCAAMAASETSGAPSAAAQASWRTGSRRQVAAPCSTALPAICATASCPCVTGSAGTSSPTTSETPRTERESDTTGTCRRRPSSPPQCGAATRAGLERHHPAPRPERQT